jgi:tryptophan synthase alpha chain
MVWQRVRERRVSDRLAVLSKRPGLGPGLVIYLTVGDPDLATSRAVALAAIDAGADVLELGVPFSDPLADGPVIERASQRAVRNGVTLAHVLQLAAEIREQRPSAGLVLFSYFNPIVRYGLEKFCRDAKQAGADGVLVTDMTVEEAEGGYLASARAAGLDTIFLAAPTSTDARLERIAAASRGFVYAISRTGITGTRQTVHEDARGLVERLRRYTHLPIALGFGISQPQHVAALAEFADAAVIGSAVVGIIEQAGAAEAPQAVAEFVAGLRPQAALAR